MNELIKQDFVLNEIEAAFESVPFGNSDFQNRFLSTCQETDARKYRHVLLQMHQKLQALKQAEFTHRRALIDIEELEAKIKISKGFELRRYKVDLEEKLWGRDCSVKLINDAIRELNTFYSIYKELPKITLKEFDAGEREYWEKRLAREAQLTLLTQGSIGLGAATELLKLEIDPIKAQFDLQKINQNNLRLLAGENNEKLSS